MELLHPITEEPEHCEEQGFEKKGNCKLAVEVLAAAPIDQDRREGSTRDKSDYGNQASQKELPFSDGEGIG